MRWLKLLLDQETAIMYDKMLVAKLGLGKDVIVDTLLTVLRELITSRRSIKSRQKSLFQFYNKPRLMGCKGSNIE